MYTNIVNKMISSFISKLWNVVLRQFVSENKTRRQTSEDDQTYKMVSFKAEVLALSSEKITRLNASLNYLNLIKWSI